MSILNPLRNVRSCMAFAENLSSYLKTEHAIKIKPIKMCHVIAKSVLGEQFSWNLLHDKLKTLDDNPVIETNLKPLGKNTALFGISGTGKSSLMIGTLINKHMRYKKKALIIDAGRNYELFASMHDDIVHHQISDSKADIPELAGRINIIDLENLLVSGMDEYIAKLQQYLSENISQDTDIFIDETNVFPDDFLIWCLCECASDVTVSFSLIRDLDRLPKKLFNYKTTQIQNFYV